MSKVKSNAWLITHRSLTQSKVIFEKELTVAEAKLAFQFGDEEDIIDEDNFGDREVTDIELLENN